MDPHDAVALARPPSIVRNLERLPRELIHQALDHFPLLQVLQILSHNNQHLDNAVLSHHDYGKLFATSADITLVVPIFVLYREVCRFTHTEMCKKWWPLGLTGTATKQHLNSTPRGLLHETISYLQAEITQAWPEPWSYSYALLENQLPKQQPIICLAPEDRLAHLLQSDWQWIKKAKLKLNMKKSQQLLRAAELVVTYPGKLILKRKMDPDQHGPRENSTHIANAFITRAKKARSAFTLTSTSPGSSLRCRPGTDNIELVPYDRYLSFLYEILSTKSFQVTDTTLEEKFSEMALPYEGKKNSNERTPYKCPSEILDNLKIVKKGIMNVYTGSPLLVVPRVVFEDKTPKFFVNAEPHSPDLPKTLHRCNGARIAPYDDREYDWLEAFLKVVTWMENEFGYEKAKKENDRG